MDVCKVRSAGAAVLRNKTPTEDTLRRPLVPSEKNNAVPTLCRPRTAEVSSRYKSGILLSPTSATGTPRRCASPTAVRTGSLPGMAPPKRSQSAERRPSTPSSRLSGPSRPCSRPSTPSSPSFSGLSRPSSRPSTPSSPSSVSTTPVRDTTTGTQARRLFGNRSPDGLRSSRPSSRPSSPSSPSSRSITPVRGTTTGTPARRLFSNMTPDGLWPSMRNLASSFQSESVSLAVDKKEKVVPNCTSQTTKSSSNSGTERKKTPLRGKTLSEQSENARPIENSNTRAMEQNRWPSMLGGRLTTNTLSSRSVDLTNQVARSVSLSAASQVIAAKRSIPLSHGVNTGSLKSSTEGARRLSIDGSKRAERDRKSSVNSSSQISERASTATWPSRAQLSLTAVHHRPSMPNKVSSSTSSTTRGMMSPTRTRPSTSISSSCNGNIRAGPTSSVLNCIVDVHRGKKNASQIEDCHQLRLLHNAVSQWRFVNALTSETLSIQKMRTENILYSVFNNISVMRDSVIMKRIHMQHLQQQMKLRAILKEQMSYLEHWVTLEREHSSSLSGAVEAFKASTLRLPVTGGAKADICGVKNAVSSIVDVMQSMASSICNFLSKVESTKSLVSELATVAEEEKFSLNECRELLASMIAMQVQESSLRTHLIQLKQDTCI